MQNKANFRKREMSVSPYNTKAYEDLGDRRLCKSKAKQSQSNPISRGPKRTLLFESSGWQD